MNACDFVNCTEDGRWGGKCPTHFWETRYVELSATLEGVRDALRDAATVSHSSLQDGVKQLHAQMLQAEADNGQTLTALEHAEERCAELVKENADLKAELAKLRAS